jgi:hypothetical protein
MALINSRVWVMKPDSKQVVDEATQVLHHGWDEGQDMLVFAYGHKEVGQCGSWIHSHCMPLIFLTSTLPKHMQLLYMTNSMASRRAFGLIPYCLEISGDEKKPDSLSRHCDVLMLG